MDYYLNYSSIADDTTMAILIIFFFIIKSSLYSRSDKNIWLRLGLNSLMLATLLNATYMTVIEKFPHASHLLIYALRDGANILLMCCLAIFSKYLCEMFDKNPKTKRSSSIYNIVTLVTVSTLIIISPITHFGFYIEGSTVKGTFFIEPFTIGYLSYVFEIFVQLIRYRKNILRKAYFAIWGTFVLAEGIMITEAATNSATFVCFTFVLPLLIVFALFHSNSYDIITGTLDNYALNEYLKSISKTKKKYLILSLTFTGNKPLDNFLKYISSELHHFYDKFFYGTFTFRVSERMFVLVCDGIKPNDEKKLKKEFTAEFNKLYDVYQMKFKFVGLEINEFVKDYDSYYKFVKYIESRMEDNTFKTVSTKEISDYMSYLSVLELLKDIDDKKDLNDERVLVYTQPIYDTKSKKIKTAESLMRLKLNDEIIYPDRFISIAEENNLIHTLSLIMLNKVCKNIKEIKKKYELERISVNFSTIELGNINFKNEIKDIITKNKIPFESIGIEITESQTIEASESIINTVKSLNEMGIKLYLDDFGTGYSNFERIMQMPFDIIKFDKSLLDSSKTDKNFKIMTQNFSKTYHDLGYKILFEGVETEKDTKMCKSELNANYLQGYFYSRPIPIENLETFLTKKNTKK